MRPLHIPLSRIALSLCILVLCFFAGVPAKAQTLQTSFDSNGLSALTYNGVTFYSKSLGVGQEFYIGGDDWDVTSKSWNATTKTLTWVYPWGNVACKYDTPIGSSRLNMEIKVTNTTSSARSGMNIFPLTVDFPQTPVGYDNFTPHASSNSEGPTVQNADYGGGNLTIVNQDVYQNLIVGLLPSNTTSNTLHRYSVYVGSTPLWYGSSEWPQFNRTIPPNSSDTYKISLRFSPAGADTYAVAGDVYSAYAAANPFQLNWNDRRPIGALALAEPPGSAYNTPNNPRGWNPKDGLPVDASTPAGVADLRSRMLAFADRSIAILKDRDAQGMITWDIEGAEYPHATTYIGDPRLITNLGPEMDGVADAYFQKFRNAGLRVGICIRPQQLRNNSGNGGDILPSTPKSSISNPGQFDTAIYNQLINKIDYAKNRWGCTLFYVDSNLGGKHINDILAIKAVAADRPDVLLMPEHGGFSYYAYSAPFSDLSGTAVNGTFPGTPPDVRRTYPNAFSAIKIDDHLSVLDSIRPQVVDAVQKGDVLIFNAWYESDESNRVKSIYAEAYPLRVTTTQDVVDSSDGKVSLREAITYANSHPGYDNITFAPSAWGTIKLNGTALPTVTGDCFLNGGSSVTVDGDAKSRIMKIANGATVIVGGMYFTNGKAPINEYGGAFYNDGNLTITHCAVKNSTGYYGGGIFNTGTFLLVNSTFSGNSALDSGGAITNVGTVTLENSTLSGNNTTANSTGGAGIDSYGGGATINLNFCTITANTGANATANARAGIWMTGGSNLSIANTIVYGNGTRDIQHDTTNVSSGGYNIVGSKGSATGFLSSDKLGVNPLLGPLQNNGGPTNTHAIASGSPAINASNPNITSGTDQRGGGYPRVLNGRADIGSLESNFATPSVSSSLMAPSNGSS